MISFYSKSKPSVVTAQNAKIIGWSPNLLQKVIKYLRLQYLYIKNTIPMEIVDHYSLMEKLGEIFNGEGKDHIPYQP